jgi:hypothetical protein
VFSIAFGARAGDVSSDPGAFAETNGFTLIPPGRYRMAGGPQTFESTGTLVLPGATFAGPVYPAGETDGVALSGGFSFSVLSAVHSAKTAGTLHASLAIGATQEAGDYEKMGIYSRVVTSDGSVYGNQISNRDAVGVESQCRFSDSIQSGRCWAFDSVTTVPKGTDGYAVGEEITIANDGSDQPEINHPTSKIGLHLVAGGNIFSTAGIVFTGSKNALWHDGIVFKRSAVAGYAIVVRDDTVSTADPIASIGMAGDAVFHDVTATGVFRHAAAQRDTPESGQLISIQPNIDTEILVPTVRIESARVALPPGRSGADLRILCTGRISHLTILATSAPVHGLRDMPCEPGRGHQFSYNPTDGWIQIF